MIHIISNQTEGKLVNENPARLTVLTQDKAHDSRSDRYSLVKTSDVIQEFEKAGFTWKKAGEERSTAKYKGFGTHLVAFEKVISSGDSELDKEILPRIYFKNSYHGRCRFRFDLGLFRTYCLNGLILGNFFDSVNKRHKGIEQLEVAQIINQMESEYRKLVPVIQHLRNTMMTESQKIEFANFALVERLNTTPFQGAEISNLWYSRRLADDKPTLWNVLNRVQENLGLNMGRNPIDLTYQVEVTDEDGVSTIKERKLKRLNNIDEVTRLNKLLFQQIQSYIPVENTLSVAVAA